MNPYDKLRTKVLAIAADMEDGVRTRKELKLTSERSLGRSEGLADSAVRLRAIVAECDAGSPMKVLVESPFAGDVERNLRYLRACMRDCFLRGELPFASHALYTQPGVLDDNDPAERQLGIDAGLAWGAHAVKTVVYTDLGMSRGMRYGIDNATAAGRPVEYRTLPGWAP